MEQSLSDWKICLRMDADAGGECIRILYNNSMWTSRVPELIDENELDNVDEGMLEYEDDFDYEFAERNAQEYEHYLKLAKRYNKL